MSDTARLESIARMKLRLLALLAFPFSETTAAPLSIFRGPEVIDSALTITSLTADDFNRDGTLDFSAAEGTDRVSIFLQDSSQQDAWRRVRLSVGVGSFFLLASDFDSDGDDDLAIADPGSVAYLLRSKGDGSFEPPQPLPDAHGPRWLASGDFNDDGRPDLATANFAAHTSTVFLAHSSEILAFAKSYRVNGYPHAIQALDFDADGRVDLMVKLSDVGIVPLHGNGDGAFDDLPLIVNLGTDGNIVTGDINQDGKGDLAIDCCGAGVSHGDGTYRKTLDFAGFGRVRIADLNRDGRLDILQSQLPARPREDGLSLILHPGTGDGSFLAPVAFPGPDGLDEPHLWDLNGDGFLELVSGSLSASKLVIAWGIEREPLFELGISWSGFSNARVMAVSPPRAGEKAEFLFPSTTQPEIQVYRSQGLSDMAAPAYTIRTASPFTSLVTADMDGDAIWDLAGANGPKGTVLVSLLGPTGQPREESEKPTGLIPLSVVVSSLDEDPMPDLAAACFGSSEIAIFPGRHAAMSDAILLPTIERPRDLAAGDLNDDGHTDLVVSAAGELAVQTAGRDGKFSQPISLIKDSMRFHSDLSLEDVTADGLLDLLVLDNRSNTLELLVGRGNASFEAPVPYPVGELPVSIASGDLNEDGLIDLTVACSKGESVTVLLNRGEKGFVRFIDQWVGFSPQGHALASLEPDSGLALVAFSSNATIVLPRRRSTVPTSSFLRADSNGDGKVDLSDALRTLGTLFLGAGVLPCPDAADANDDGAINITDAVYALDHLFRGGSAPPAPYPERGADPTADGLGCAF